jgi:hypothetical protein
MQEHPGQKPHDPPAVTELPVPGYPISEAAVGDWFLRTYGREPTERELGAVMDAMARREATPPVEGPVEDT